MPFSFAAAATAAVGAYSSYKSGQAASRAANSQADVARQQAQIAGEQWDAYKENIQPLETQAASEAANYASIANKEKAAGQAAADVTSQFAGLRDRLNKSPGFNPNSEAYLRTMADLGLSEAAQRATAETGARDKVQQMGDAKRTDAISLGKGLAANAQTGLAAAGNAQAGVAAAQTRNAEMAGNFAGQVLGSKQFQNWAGGLNAPASSASASPSNADLEQIWAITG